MINEFALRNVDPNVVTFTLQDQRLEYLRKLFVDRRSQEANEREPGGCTRITLLDIRGVIPGDYTKDIFGNDTTNSSSSSSSSSDGSFLANVDVILHILRGFEDKELTHIEETVDPLRDFKAGHTELMAKVRCCYTIHSESNISVCVCACVCMRVSTYFVLQ